MDKISTYSLLAGAMTLCQTILFVVLHDSSIRLAIAFGEPSHVRDGVAWGIMAQYSGYLFAAVCFVSAFLTFSFSGFKKAVVLLKSLVLLAAFGFFASLTAAWTHPKRSLLLASCALVAMVVPHFGFYFISQFNEKRGQRWVCF